MASTPGPPRRTIRELVARYCLEPELLDIYVEGPRDKGWYGLYFQKVECKGAAVYEIDTVDVAADTVRDYSLELGNRGRVLAVALELDRCFPATLKGVRCVADSDYDFVLGRNVLARHLLYTDYTSPELYMWKHDILERILVLGFMVPPEDVASIFESVSLLVEELFTIRAANKKLCWGANLVRFAKSCTIDGPTIVFDRENFVQRYLNAHGRMGQRAEFEKACDGIRPAPGTDRRRSISGDDLVEAIGWYLKEGCNWDGYRNAKRSATPIVMSALDISSLAGERLFRILGQLCA